MILALLLTYVLILIKAHNKGSKSKNRKEMEEIRLEIARIQLLEKKEKLKKMEKGI